MSSNATTANGARREDSASRWAIPWMHVGGVALAAVAAVATMGCEATIQPASPFAVAYAQGDLMVRAEIVPRNIWAYPHVAFGTSYVYLVDGRWYYPTPEGWMIFRREPVELSRQRTLMGQGRFRGPYHGYPTR